MVCPQGVWLTPQGVVIDIPLQVEDVSKLEQTYVALFNVSLVPLQLSASNEVEINLSQKTLASEEIKQLMDFGSRLLSMGVGLVASQKLIHPLLQQFLLQKVNLMIPSDSSGSVSPRKAIQSAH